MLRKFIILALLLPLFGFTQNVALRTILKQIGAQHDVRFSYIEDEIAVYALERPAGKSTLKQKLAYIEQRTSLKFESVTQNYYTISNDRKLDKPLCAYVVDSSTGRGIENVRISIQGQTVEVFSNSEGYFELPVLGPDAILIHHLGYHDIGIEPQRIYVANCPKIELKPIVEQLSPVFAQPYIATGITKNDNGTLTVRPGKFGILPGLTEPDVLLAMQQVPGISSVDETVSNINVRGGSHDQNQFLWNGIRMFQTGHFFGLISAFNPMLATNVSISKNGSSALYGEGVSSLVDISSHTKRIDSCYNAVSVDLISANFFSKIKLSDKATIQAAGRRTFTDVVTTPTFKMYRDRVFDNTEIYDVTNGRTVRVRSESDFYFYDFSLQYHQKIGDRHEFVLDGIGIRNELRFDQNRDPETVRNSISQQDFGASLHWRSHWNDRHSSEFQAYASNYNQDSASNSLILETSDSNSIRDFGLRIHHSYVFSKFIDLTFGYQYDNIRVSHHWRALEADRDERGNGSASHAAIGEADYASENGKTKIRAGLRFNYFERFSTLLVEPRLVFVRYLSDEVKLELLGERKSQTLSQLSAPSDGFFGLDNKRWLLADESGIPLQKSTQFSIGLSYEKKGWLVTLDNFYKKVTGINAAEQDFRNQFRNTDATGSYTVLGSEVFVQKVIGNFHSWISYAYTDNRYDFDAFEPSRFDNNFAIQHAVSWAGLYDWNGLRFALGAKRHSGRVTTLPVAFEPDADNPRILYESPNASRLKEYVQVNFSASKNWTLDTNTILSVGASVVNLLDRENVLNRYYRIGANQTVEKITSHGLGMTPNVSIKLLF